MMMVDYGLDHKYNKELVPILSLMMEPTCPASLHYRNLMIDRRFDWWQELLIGKNSILNWT